jgi:hypothetical protein
MTDTYRLYLNYGADGCLNDAHLLSDTILACGIMVLATSETWPGRTL